MSRFKVFNPADYKMVNGKVVPKYQPAGTVKDFEEVQVTDASGNPKTANGGTLYIYDVSLGDGKVHRIFREKSEVDKGNMDSVVQSQEGTLNNAGTFTPTITYAYDIYDTPVSSKAKLAADQSPYSIAYEGDGSSGVSIGYGPSYGGYGYKQEGWKGDISSHIKDYENLLRSADNQDMVNSMYDKYKGVAQNAGLPIMSKDEFVDILVRGQEDNALIRDVYGEEFATGALWDTGIQSGLSSSDPRYKSQMYYNVMNQLGRTGMTEDESKQFQAAFMAANNAVQNDPNFMDKFRKAGFQTNPSGKIDEDLGNISNIEGWYGNTTAGYLFTLAPPPEPEEKEEDPTKPEQVYYCVKDDSGSRVIGPFAASDPAPTGASSGPSSKEDAEKICNVKTQELEQSAPAPDTWFGNDVRNYITGLGQKMFKGRPGLFQVDPAPYGYALESPDTLIAATTGMSNQYNTMLQNTMAGPAAAAASLGAQGTFLNQLSQDIAGVQNRNVDRLNQAYGQRAQIDQNVNALNTQARKQFLDESNIYGQERVNAMNKRAAMITSLYNRGEENRFNDEMLRYIYPQATYPNRLNMGKTWDWSGQGKNSFLPDTSGSSGTTTADLNSGAFDAYNAAYKAHLDEYKDEEAARRYAENVQKEYYTRNRNASKQNQGYAQARLEQNQSVSGKTGGSMKFGANFTTPWGY